MGKIIAIANQKGGLPTSAKKYFLSTLIHREMLPMVSVPIKSVMIKVFMMF